jgi:hypothetical protein
MSRCMDLRRGGSLGERGEWEAWEERAADG